MTFGENCVRSTKIGYTIVPAPHNALFQCSPAVFGTIEDRQSGQRAPSSLTRDSNAVIGVEEVACSIILDCELILTGHGVSKE
jgi:hypothetical protein